MGMVCASRLAERRGLVGPELMLRLQRLLVRLRLPPRPTCWPRGALLASMHNDKKALAGKLRFVLSRKLGEVTLFDDVPESDVLHVLEELCV
jgi:3-dehydroquinate synthetase